MAQIIGTIKKIGQAAVMGFISSQSEPIIKGFLIEYMHQAEEENLKHDTPLLDAITNMVLKNQPLWSLAKLEHHELIRKNISRLGSLDFFTAEWVITAMKEDFPAIASLFLGWKKAHNWLEHQVESFLKEIGG